MQFQIGDQVVHPVHGVGTIQTRSAQSFGSGEQREYYEVKMGQATVWVPIDDQGLTVLRRVASQVSLKACRKVLSSTPVPLDPNPKTRQLGIAEQLKDGSLSTLCELVRDLRARGAQVPLNANEERSLRRAYKMLCDEWAAAEGSNARAAGHEIEALLESSLSLPEPAARRWQKWSPF